MKLTRESWLRCTALATLLGLCLANVLTLGNAIWAGEWCCDERRLDGCAQEFATFEPDSGCDCQHHGGGCPYCPCNGTCGYCSVAKVPCHVIVPAAILEDNLPQAGFFDTPSQYSSPFAGRLMRPPRAS
jgi:hypothetical protein